ncbi:hypothetical protein Hamer_G002419, partial [Homarus americanus]
MSNGRVGNISAQLTQPVIRHTDASLSQHVNNKTLLVSLHMHLHSQQQTVESLTHADDEAHYGDSTSQKKNLVAEESLPSVDVTWDSCVTQTLPELIRLVFIGFLWFLLLLSTLLLVLATYVQSKEYVEQEDLNNPQSLVLTLMASKYSLSASGSKLNQTCLNARSTNTYVTVTSPTGAVHTTRTIKGTLYPKWMDKFD